MKACKQCIYFRVVCNTLYKCIIINRKLAYHTCIRCILNCSCDDYCIHKSGLHNAIIIKDSTADVLLASIMFNTFQVMHHIGNNRFFQPLLKGVLWYSLDKVITVMQSEPEPVTFRHCMIHPHVWDLINEELDLQMYTMSMIYVFLFSIVLTEIVKGCVPTFSLSCTCTQPRYCSDIPEQLNCSPRSRSKLPNIQSNINLSKIINLVAVRRP